MSAVATTKNRNQPCPCGSGKKYKQCCMNKQIAKGQNRVQLAWILIGMLLLAGAVGMFAGMFNEHSSSASGGEGRVWSEEHGHYH
jgi:hypothetical protein